MRTPYEEVDRRAQSLQSSTIGKALHLRPVEARMIVELVMTEAEIESACSEGR